MDSMSPAAITSATRNRDEPDYRLALDTAGAAKVTGLSKIWLEQLRSQNRGPKYVKIGKRVLYRPADLAAWLAEHVKQPKAA